MEAEAKAEADAVAAVRGRASETAPEVGAEAAGPGVDLVSVALSRVNTSVPKPSWSNPPLLGS